MKISNDSFDVPEAVCDTLSAAQALVSKIHSAILIHMNVSYWN